MVRRGFTLLEVLTVVGILAIISGVSVPMYRNYQIRNDLATAKNQITQGLQRAKLNAEAGKNDKEWGFYIPAGILFEGDTYTDRDQTKDEVYPMPSSIKTSGLTQVTYDETGRPDTTGTINLTALNGDRDSIQITIAIDMQTVSTTIGDSFRICKNGQTLTVTDATWPTHQAQGATMGPCASPSSSSSVSSSSSSSVSSSSSSSSAGGTICSGKVTVASNGLLTIPSNQASVSIQYTNLISAITFGSGGPNVPVWACHTDDSNGTNFRYLDTSNGNCGTSNGHTVSPGGDSPVVKSYQGNDKIIIRVRGRYTQNGWLAFDETVDSNDQSGQFIWLKNGDNVSTFPGFGNQTSLKTWLNTHNNAQNGNAKYAVNGIVNLPECQRIGITELGTLNSSGADFQDYVVLMKIQ